MLRTIFRGRRWAVAAVAISVALTGLVAACDEDDGEDRPGSVSVIDGGSASGSVSGVSGSVSGVGPGVVEPPPESAIEVGVTLAEWAVSPEVASVQAGEIYFLANNAGPNDEHELVIIRSDLPIDELPTDERGFVPEDEVDFIGEIEAFSPGTQASGTFDLEPGRYILICNIVELEDGEWESHYRQGMRVEFTVE